MGGEGHVSSAVHAAERPLTGAGRVSVLHGWLRSLSQEAPEVDTAVTTCLVWVAGVLVEIAGDVADARSAGALMHEASAVLASVPTPPGRAPGPRHCRWP